MQGIIFYIQGGLFLLSRPLVVAFGSGLKSFMTCVDIPGFYWPSFMAASESIIKCI